MKPKKDLNYIAKVEKAIAKKYGDIAIQNPASFWNEEKEKKYLEQSKKKKRKSKTEEKTSLSEDVFVFDKGLAPPERECPICGAFSFNRKDDVYMYKFKACFKCYIKYVEHREERWFSGWRPKN